MQALHQPNIDNASIQDMISLLKQYELMCLNKSDFSSAEQAKNKIEFLKTQQLIFKKEKMEFEDKENMENVSKQGDQEIRVFQEYWDNHLQQLIQNLKEVERDLENQHQRQLSQMETNLLKEQPPKMKFSSEVLFLRKYLSNLIKVKNYKQAEITKNKLSQLEAEENQKWLQKHELKKQSKIETLKKKQQSQLNALRIKAEAAFNQNIKERDQKFEMYFKINIDYQKKIGKEEFNRVKYLEKDQEPKLHYLMNPNLI